MSPVLKSLLQKAKWRLLAAFVTGAISGTCAGALIASIQRIIAHIEQPSAWHAVVFGALVVAHIVARMISQSEILTALQLRVIPDLRTRLPSSIVSAPLRTIEAIAPGRLMGALTGDVQAIDIASHRWILVAHTSLAIVTCLVSLALLSPLLLLAVAVSFALGLIVYYGVLVFVRREVKLAQEARTRVYEHLEGIITGTKELLQNSARRTAYLAEAIKPSVTDFHGRNIKALATNDIAAAWAAMLMFLIVGLLLFVWPHIMPIQSSTVLAAAVAVLYVQSELASTLEIVPLIAKGEEAMRSIERIGLRLGEVTEDCTSADAESRPGWKRLEIDSVTHKYRGEEETDEFTLGPINLTFEPGEIVYIVGGNGSGKSTLAKVLVGLYEPEGGEIRIDGERVGPSTLRQYRDHFAAIFSDFWLFDRLYGISADADPKEQLSRFGLAQKVEVKEGKFSTLDLSQGQKKRIALVTASLEDRDIYVLDEWAADQEPTFKEEFYTRVLPELKARGKTAIVITHDDRFIRFADRVIRLHEGKLVG